MENKRREKKEKKVEKESIEGLKLADGVQYGYATLEDNSKQPVAILSKDILNITKTFNHKQTASQWFKYVDNIYLTIYWTKRKRGLVFRFSFYNDRKLIRAIIKKKSLALSNSGEAGRILLIDIPKNDPLKWFKEKS